MRNTRPLFLTGFCSACGSFIDVGEGQKFKQNEESDAWLCNICNEEYWSIARGGSWASVTVDKARVFISLGLRKW